MGGCMFPRDTSAPSRPTGEQNKNNDGSTNRRTSNLRQATRSAVLGGRCIGIALLMYRSPWLQPPPAPATTEATTEMAYPWREHIKLTKEKNLTITNFGEIISETNLHKKKSEKKDKKAKLQRKLRKRHAWSTSIRTRVSQSHRDHIFCLRQWSQACTVSNSFEP